MSQRSRRWLWLLLLIPVAVGFFRLRFDVDVLNLLPDDVPTVRGLKLYQKHFANARELIITLRASDAEASESAARSLAQTLRGATNLVRTVHWQPPWLEQPAQFAELIGYLWLNQPPALFGELTNRLAPANVAATLAEMRERLATSMSPTDLAGFGYDPYGLLRLPESTSGGPGRSGQGEELFGSADGTFRLMFVEARGVLVNYRQCQAWIDAVKQVIERWRAENPAQKVKFQFTGRPAFEAEIAGSMEGDMTASVGITSVIIAVLFWLAHRRITPMLWLLALLAVILAATLALGGLIFGAVNVVSLGFAGILLGLAVDYGVVHYQEAIASPDATIPEIRRAIGPSIFWAAITTISAFLVLNFGGLPGLAQLGSLVAVGVGLSALVMLFAFLPPLFRDRMKKREAQIKAGTFVPEAFATTQGVSSAASRGWAKLVYAATAVAFLVAVLILARGWPHLDRSSNALRPRNSTAYAALDEIKAHITQGREPLWLMTTSRDVATITARLQRAMPLLERAVSNRHLASFTLPTPIWPQPEFQRGNRAGAAFLVTQREALCVAAQAAGFSSNSCVLTENILNTWQAALNANGVFWPTNDASRWVFDKVIARSGDDLLALGLVSLPTNAVTTPRAVAVWADELTREGFLVSGWELLGASVLERVQKTMPLVVVPMIALVMLTLWLAFRRPTEILLSMAVMGFSGLLLLAVMRSAGWSWNLLNLMALPLLLGTGVDYSIFMQLALRRHRGDLLASYRSVGRALLLCGGTAVAGFASLAWSANAGMASLGQVCAVGIGGNMLISVCLLPVWWRRFAGSGRGNESSSAPAKPSSLYRAGFWKLGLLVGRRLPARIAVLLSRVAVALYGLFANHRRAAVVENLLPALGNDRPAAEQAASRMFQQFALKLVDLWRYESGQPVDDLFAELTGWEHFTAAHARGKGVLMVTPHLGNWEFGGPLLTRRGIKLHVITLVEPGEGLTELRQASRARWGIETMVIGQDAFAFVEVIKRLQEGATVALLMDRPPESSATEVELFGRSFKASIAAAELARASGAALVPVYLPRTAQGYAAHVLPEIPYDPATLGNREARRELTQKILRAFEPAIRQHLDQWFHFVPVWPKS